jgi:hypothetical protein
MGPAVIGFAIVAGAFLSAVLIGRRYGVLAAVFGGALSALLLWGLAALGSLYWFANS